MLTGFIMASYSLVSNDVIQTLGTFLSSNKERPWWFLWLFSCLILTAIFIFGWLANNGDISYGRLQLIPFPEQFTWVYLVPPIVLVILTQLGIPVSTTFLILTVFAPQALNSMLIKSLLGYVLALVTGIVIYKFVARGLESHFLEDKEGEIPRYWIVLQWLCTAFLWSQWLIQDMANIFAYLPRRLSLSWLIFSLAIIIALHGILFYRRGGEVQKIVTSKTNTQDIRSATIIDFIYGSILVFFIQLSRVPMSTTWVFIGLLGGRELAITLNSEIRPLKETGKIIAGDSLKALIGLIVSVLLAFGLPLIEKAIG
ncbi:MAG: hypothetical protein SXA11_24845 [Cyanobacteriota bacterium]|nr:hypothetical protein [Cyanobacteriota bacterium]